MFSRRVMIKNSLSAIAGITIAHNGKGLAQANPAVSLNLAKVAPVEIPSNFTGLGYEMSSVATPDLLSPTNKRYVNLVRALGPQGVVRAGGIVANYTRYVPDGTPAWDRKKTVITRRCLDGFAAFLDETGWSTIWSVNFAQGTIDEALEEARAVSDVLGTKLLALEIGNEVDSYGKGQPFRTTPYDYEAYRKEYRDWHERIVSSLPGIRLAAPDTTARAEDWVERMARDANGEVQLLTTHYYRDNQSRGSREQLLTHDQKLIDDLVQLRQASQQNGIPWRMCEINSFSGGGRPGVSDSLVGALWTLDTMLLLAQYGCAGVNMETGMNQLGFVSSYSPIQDNGKGVNSAGVPYYGMLAFATAFAGCHQLLPLDSSNSYESLHSYVLGAHGEPRSAVIVNMDSTSIAHVSVANLNIEHAAILRLTGPAAEGNHQVTLGEAAVGDDGRWRKESRERLSHRPVAVPPLSAAVIVAADAS